MARQTSIMALSGKTRKVLWGRSGNRRAICRREIVLDATPSDDASVVGDECHIVSPGRDILAQRNSRFNYGLQREEDRAHRTKEGRWRLLRAEGSRKKSEQPSPS